MTTTPEDVMADLLWTRSAVGDSRFTFVGPYKITDTARFVIVERCKGHLPLPSGNPVGVYYTVQEALASIL